MSEVRVGSVPEPASEELIRAEAEVERAFARSVDRLLGCVVALTGLAIVCVAIGDAALATGCLVAVGILVRGVGRSSKVPRGRRRSSVM